MGIQGAFIPMNSVKVKFLSVLIGYLDKRIFFSRELTMKGLNID